MKTTAPPPSKTVSVPISEIEIDGSTQAREQVDQPTLAEYEAKVKAGHKFPPVDLFHDGRRYWIGDGFHRTLAHLTNGRGDVRAKVRQGSKRDALKHALGANEDHGLKRSNADKRRAVALAREEWPDASDREIARICHVSNTFVSNASRVDGVNVYTPPAFSFASGKVRLDLCPTANELRDGVEYKDVPTWGELINDRGVPVEDVTIPEDVPTPHLRPLAGQTLQFCDRAVAIDAIQRTEPKLDIFRAKPVSAAHTDRAEKKDKEKERAGFAMEACKEISARTAGLGAEAQLSLVFGMIKAGAHPAGAALFDRQPEEMSLAAFCFALLAGQEMRNNPRDKCPVLQYAAGAMGLEWDKESI